MAICSTKNKKFLYSHNLLHFISRNNHQTAYQFGEAINMLQKSHHSHTLDGSEVIEVNQIRITSNSDGTIWWVYIQLR